MCHFLFNGSALSVFMDCLRNFKKVILKIVRQVDTTFFLNVRKSQIDSLSHCRKHLLTYLSFLKGRTWLVDSFSHQIFTEQHCVCARLLARC